MTAAVDTRPTLRSFPQSSPWEGISFNVILTVRFPLMSSEKSSAE